MRGAARPDRGPMGEPPVRLEELVDRFLLELVSRGSSGQTQNAYRVTLGGLLRFLGRHAIHEVLQVREAHLAAWAAWVKGRWSSRRCPVQRRPYRPTTVRALVFQVRPFFAWLVDRGVLLVNPARNLSVRDVPADPVASLRIPGEQELAAWLDRAARAAHAVPAPRSRGVRYRDWVVMELVYSSGLRAGEVRHLDVDDVDLSRRVVRVRRGKGRKDRVVPLGRPACRVVADWIEAVRPTMAVDRAEQALFVSALGRRLGSATLHSSFRRLRREMGLPRFRLHDLRHASALHMLRHGADLRHLAEFLGHAEIKPTQVYTRLAPADLKDAHRKAHPRERHKDRP